LDAENTWQLLSVFKHFLSKKHLVVARHILAFLIQKTSGNYQAFSTILDAKNVWQPPDIFYDLWI
jgi:hypothetical protein